MYIEHATSWADVVAQRNARFELELATGKWDPYLLPAEGMLLVIFAIYLWIPHSNSRLLQFAAYPTFGLITYLAVDTMRRCRSLGMGAGYGIGIANAWLIIWSATMLTFSDGQKMARIEKRVGNATHVQPDLSVESLLSVSTGVGVTSDPDWASKEYRPLQALEASEITNKQHNDVKAVPVKFVWQPLPKNGLHRLDWVIDLIFTFRGDGWNWKITGLSRYPEDVHKQLQESDISYMPANRGLPFKDIKNNRTLLKANLITAVRSLILLDIFHVIMMKDPWFWGRVAPDTPPAAIIPNFIAANWVLLRCYRTLLPFWALSLNLTMMMCGSPLFFLAVAHFLPWITKAQIDEPWLYSPVFRGFFPAMFEHGIGGFWSRCWHSLFRHGFSAPTTWAIKKFNLNPKSDGVKLMQLTVAFALSGFIHFCAAYTQFPPYVDNKPWGPFLFFILQPVGITIQTKASAYLNKKYAFPKWIRQAANFAFAFIWFMWCGPIHFDDFSRGGLWLIEPIPISPVSLIGFTHPDDRHIWRWGNFGLVWHGRGWWKGPEWRLW